jgi:hypothetical protein
MVRGILATLDDTPLDRRDAALIASLFAGALRRSEIAGLDYGAAGTGDGYLQLTDRAVEIVLLRSKARTEPVSVLVPRAENPGLVAALERWVAAAGIALGEPLFRSIKKCGHIRGRLRYGGVSLALKARIARVTPSGSLWKTRQQQIPAPILVTIRDGETILLRNFAVVTPDCRSMFQHFDGIDTMVAPPEVTLTFEPGKVYVTNLASNPCEKPVSGGNIIISAKDVTEQREAELVIRLRYTLQNTPHTGHQPLSPPDVSRRTTRRKMTGDTVPRLHAIQSGQLCCDEQPCVSGVI